MRVIRIDILSALVLTTALIACGPSQEDLDAANARIAELEGELDESRSSGDDLARTLAEVRSQNEQMADRLRALGQELETTASESQELQSSLEETRRALDELRERERQAQARLETFRDLLSRFQELIDSGQLRVRIANNQMLVELPEGVLFDSGRAELKEDGQTTLQAVVEVLRSIEDRNFQVAGHTDNIPIRTRRFRSNWELSTQRAVNVARYMIEQGLGANRISAAGYADTVPVSSNETAEGRAQNRRIDIVLQPNLNELPDLSSLEQHAQ